MNVQQLLESSNQYKNVMDDKLVVLVLILVKAGMVLLYH